MFGLRGEQITVVPVTMLTVSCDLAKPSRELNKQAFR